MNEIAAGGNSPALHMASNSPRIFKRAWRIEIGVVTGRWRRSQLMAAQIVLARREGGT
jgi:hypothetical protein